MRCSCKYFPLKIVKIFVFKEKITFKYFFNFFIWIYNIIIDLENTFNGWGSAATFPSTCWLCKNTTNHLVRVPQILRSLEAYMIINFRVRRISQDAHKLTRTPVLIYKKKNS